MRAALLVLLVACGSSPPPPPKPPPLVAAEPGVCVRACSKREQFGCLEQELKSVCVSTCEKAAAAGLYSPECVAAATTRDALLACPRVRCRP